jgi:hypothetical protein
MSPDSLLRAFVSFLVGSLPPGAQVESATLWVNQITTLGSPFSVLGSLIASHVNIGDFLDAGDYDTPILSLAGTISNSETNGWKSIDVTAQVKADLTALRGRSQFRLQFYPFDGNDDGQSTGAQVGSGDDQGLEP